MKLVASEGFLVEFFSGIFCVAIHNTEKVKGGGNRIGYQVQKINNAALEFILPSTLSITYERFYPTPPGKENNLSKKC